MGFLASLYSTVGRFSDAEPLLKRAIPVLERINGNDHLSTIKLVSQLAKLYLAQARYGEAEPLYRRALESNERTFGGDHPETIKALYSLSVLYQAQGRLADAEQLQKRALQAYERTMGNEHPITLVMAGNLAALYQTEGRYREAEPLLKRALEAQERVLGKEHPSTLVTIANLASLYFAQHDWVRAAELWRRYTAALIIRGKKKTEAEVARVQFRKLIKVVYRLTPEGSVPDTALASETFEAAQLALDSEAAQSLAQMAARGAKGDPRLAATVRERQDLVAEWQKRDDLRTDAFGQASDKRNAKGEAENLGRLTAIDARLAIIDKELAANFMDYTALSSPAPLSIKEAQTQLGSDEALVLFLDTQEFKPAPEETFVWVVTKTGMRWVRSDLGTAALAREVQALRCGVDSTAWDGDGWQKCNDLTQAEPVRRDGDIVIATLPFDFARAHKLYQALFGQAEDLIQGKSLLIVPSGPLTQLPFQVLVTKPPESGDVRSAAWLVRDHALTVLPAVSSLMALRRVGRPSAAKKTMIGFGNPLLDGDPDNEDDRRRAQDARDF